MEDLAINTIAQSEIPLQDAAERVSVSVSLPGKDYSPRPLGGVNMPPLQKSHSKSLRDGDFRRKTPDPKLFLEAYHPKKLRIRRQKNRVSTGSQLRSGVYAGNKKWRRRDSNPRPQRCERCALPTELRPHKCPGCNQPGTSC